MSGPDEASGRVVGAVSGRVVGAVLDAIERTEYEVFQASQTMSCVLRLRNGDLIEHEVKIKDGDEQKAKAEAYDGAVALLCERRAGNDDAGVPDESSEVSQEELESLIVATEYEKVGDAWRCHLKLAGSNLTAGGQYIAPEGEQVSEDEAKWRAYTKAVGGLRHVLKQPSGKALREILAKRATDGP